MDNNEWINLKARLLSAGSAILTGYPAESFIAKSTAGPGAGGSGSVFFSIDGHRVRLGIIQTGPVTIRHEGNGEVLLSLDGESFPGTLERPSLHCPRQAFITLTSSCIFRCRYCNVPNLPGRRKSADEIEALVESVMGDIDAISLTSGVQENIEEEEAYTVSIVRRLIKFGLPIGVSIYPTPLTPGLLHDAGAVEVKFNLEAATPAIFAEMCPGLNNTTIRDILKESVRVFGRGHVFSNVILGLGETDEEMESCLDELCRDGIIPVVRPLNPLTLPEFGRPEPDRIIKIFRFLEGRLTFYKLDTTLALTMCPACTGCDMIPGREG
ncbi:MAG TPA: radical SAM protein [Methanospirillum sp.]|nr:radical SAM protein [Methanospirillum sp.]